MAVRRSSLGCALTCVALLGSLCWAAAQATSDLSHGFGDNIAWVPYRDALNQAKQLNKPIFLLLHKSWLKAEVASSKDIAEESKKFIMVNAEDNEEPHEDATYNVDGGYIPRLFFLTPDGQLTGVYNEAGNAAYKYYYFAAGQILTAMQRTLLMVAGAATPTAQEL